MRRIANAAVLTLAALCLTLNAQAQTATTAPERIDLSKEGEVKAIQFTLKLYETKRYAVQLPKDKYLWVYFLDPSSEGAANPLVKVDSAHSTYAGAPGTTVDSQGGLKPKINWELTDKANNKVFAGADNKVESPQITADGEYILTLKCVLDPCPSWLRVKVDKTGAQPVTVDFP